MTNELSSRQPPISFDLTAVAEIDRVAMIPAPQGHHDVWKAWLTAELAKYPAGLFPGLTIYPGYALSVDGIRISGTWWSDGIALATSRLGSATEDRPEVAFMLHHEVATWLLAKYWPPPFDTESWFSCVPGDFEYSRDALETARGGRLDLKIDEALVSQGFLHSYCKTTFDNDFSFIAGYLFLNDSEFWAAVESHEALRGKTNLVIDFFSSLDPTLNEEFFKQLPPIGEAAPARQ